MPVGKTLLLATHNAGKVREIAALLSPFNMTIISAADKDLPEPEETETTFEGNAKLKAIAAAHASGLPALADDSGFCVMALDNAPGVYSARWAGPGKDFKLAMQRVHDELVQKGIAVGPDARAAFVCVLALAQPDGSCKTFEGHVDGHVVWPPRGNKGFGYDPIFVPDGYDQTFAEIEPPVKNKISHRARAFAQFIKKIT